MMLRLFSAAIGAAMLLTTSAAMAGTTGNGSTAVAPATYSLKVGLGPQGHRLIVTLHLASTSSWAYDPSTGSLNQLPTPEENLNPTTGIGIVVKQPPASSAHRTNSDGNGGFTLPTDLTPGNYDIVISVPAHAINTKGTGGVRMAGGTSGGSKPATLTFHVIVGPTKSAAPQPKSTYLMQENAGNNTNPVSRGNVCNNRTVGGGSCGATVQPIHLDATHPPTAVVGKGSGANSSQ